MTFMTFVQFDVLYQQNRLNPASEFWVQHLCQRQNRESSPSNRGSKSNTTLVDPTGPAGRPAATSIKTNSRDFIVNQKLQTDFTVS